MCASRLAFKDRDVFTIILNQGAILAGVGIAIGLPAALAVTRMMVCFFLFLGVQPLDPLTFATVPILLLVIALLACYIPARRAVRVDPMIVLRHE